MQELTHPGGTGFWADLLGRRRLIVVLWSVIVTVIGVSQYASAPAPSVLGLRLAGVASSIDVLDHGGPPLLVSDVPYHTGIDRTHLHPAGIADDEGIYLYLPLLGHWTGERNPAVLLKWLFVGCFGLLIFLTPLLVLAIFGSLPAALIAPLLVLWKFNLTNMDIYWMQAWAMLLGIPGLLLAYRWWSQGRRRRAACLLISLGVAAGFATSVRAQAGLAILISGAGLLILAGGVRGVPRREWLVRTGLATALVVAYLSVAFGFAAVRAYRDSEVHLNASSGSSHPLWHPAYLGLGYLPNRYGIAWLDDVAIDAVARAHPGAAYLSPQYEATLRHQYFKIVLHDPGFALRTYIAKARWISSDAVSRFWLLPLLLAVALALRRGRALLVPGLLAAPGLLVGAASPLLSMPYFTYELGWLGAVGAVWLLTICWAIARLPAAVRGALRRRPPMPRPSRATAAMLVVLVAASVFAVTGHSAPTSSRDYYPAHATPFVPTSELSQKAQQTWHFGGSLPPGWHAIGGAKLERDNGGTATIGVHVLTTTTPEATEVSGPVVRLRPGSYRLVGSARILAGGVGIVVHNVVTGTPMAESNYWWLQGDYLHNALAAEFTVDRPTRVRVSLDNWATVDNASSWVVWSLALQRLGAAPAPVPAAYYAPGATLLTPFASLKGRTLRSWSFASGTPQGWSPSGQPQQIGTPKGLDVRTTSEPSARQIVSEPFSLPPGRYAVSVGGRVLTGGVEVGVLDDERSAWIATQHFWYGQRFGDARRMVATITVRARTRVRIILSNWTRTHDPRSSEWVVEQVTVIKESGSS